ncbi:unnamed protein product [Rhizoctonia solani]|uniref:RING-type domain-containing protein n=1 Tax=Rhizoctonia solani TaxID=456999 RepID=A0A8H3H4I2_9AGAM|nr:unnamed protein product [Rhizoctonia solani]
MLVLQDCPICFEEFDERVKPQTIHCGHVFCSPCLGTLSSSSSRCPICRVVFRGHRIRPIIGAMTDSESEEEKELWVSLKNIAEVDWEARNLFVKEHPSDSLKAGKMSEYIQIAADILRLLVRTERENRKLKAKLICAADIQEKLVVSNRVLEDKLRKAELRILARTPRVRPLPRAPQLVATQGSPGVSKSPPDKQVVEGSGQSVPDQQTAGGTNIVDQCQSRCRYESCIPAEFNSKQITREDHTRFARQNPERDAHGNLIRYPTIAAAIRSYRAEGKNELSLTVGEWLDLFPDTNLGPRREWIWCGKQDGTIGYVPRRCLFVRPIVET